MKVAIMQPYFLPYIGYFQLLSSVDKFIILDDVNYIKKGWINRNRILVNGSDYTFTLPLKKVSQNKKINEIFLVDQSGWRMDLIRTLHSAYSRTLMYKNFGAIVEEIIFYEDHNLSKYILNSLSKILNYIDINIELIYSSSIEISPDLRGQDRILALCQQVGATEYINLPGGRDLYSYNSFHDRNIKLSFIRPLDFNYHQFRNIFIPNLSIVDVLMFNSPDVIKNNILSNSI